jgi:Leucine-rich repeat (LRR) protein
MKHLNRLLLIVLVATFAVVPISATAQAPDWSNKCDGLLNALEYIPPHTPAYLRLIKVAEQSCGEALDYTALVALYHSTEEHLEGLGWLSDGDYCSWDGVACDLGSRVSELDLYNVGLPGSIAPEVAYLSHLQRLDLGWNDLSGVIPPELGYLGNLVYLSLVVNDLNGPIPPELGSLTNLQWLNLGYNPLGGTIPPELGNLTNLQWLGVGESELSGPIPPELGNLKSLQTLYLGWNKLSGTIPGELGKLSSLQYLLLQGNQLGGPIPTELTGLTSLQTLNLDDNDSSMCVSTQELLDFLTSGLFLYWGPMTLCSP